MILYGSTWEGKVVIRNSRWVPACGDICQPYMIHARNDGMHDFGYRCFMPREIIIDGLFVDDRNHPKDYRGMYFFSDPYATDDHTPATTPPAERPFPFEPCRKIRVRNLTTASGTKPRLSPNAELEASTAVIEQMG